MRRLHYAWVIAAATFVVLLLTAAIRATPGVLMVPLEAEFGWTRVSVSAAVAINIALFGLLGPFAASIMDRWGVRQVLLVALALLAGAVSLSTRMRSESQLMLLWGVLVGAGTGMTSMVLAAIVATCRGRRRRVPHRRGVHARQARGGRAHTLWRHRRCHRHAAGPVASGSAGARQSFAGVLAARGHLLRLRRQALPGLPPATCTLTLEPRATATSGRVTVDLWD